MGDVGRLDATGRVRVEQRPTLVRMHRRDIFSDVFGMPRGDSDGQREVRAALKAIAREGRGAREGEREEGEEEGGAHGYGGSREA